MIPTRFRFTLALSLIFLPAFGLSEINKAGIADVKSGKTTEAKASWWGFDAKDSTKILQAAINSGVKRLIVDKMKSPWIVTPIQVASDLEIIFEKGVIVEAKKGSFKGGNHSLFNIVLKNNVSLIGYGATLRMRRDDYAKAPYSKAEWRNILNIISSSNVKVYGLTLSESGGDGIYLGSADQKTPNKNIHIKDVICDKNYRQGISVISAHGLLIEDSIMKNTAGTSPEAGIDFEPNHSTNSLVNCVMKNCVSENNKGAGFLFALVYLNRDSKDISIRMENCTARGSNSSPFRLLLSRKVSPGPANGLVEMKDCTFSGGAGPGLEISQKQANGCRLRFTNCKIVHPAKNNPTIPAILFKTESGQTDTIGGIDFVNCTLVDDTTRPIGLFDDWAGGTRLVDVTGDLKVVRKGKKSVHTFDQKWLDSLINDHSIKPIPVYRKGKRHYVPVDSPGVPDNSISLRHNVTYQIYAQKNAAVSFFLSYERVGKYDNHPLKISALSPSGKSLPLGGIDCDQIREFTFRAPEAGIYQLPIKCGVHKVRLISSNRPTSFFNENGVFHFYQGTGDLYFFVPVGTKEFGVKIYGSGGEAVRASISDPTGKERWSEAHIIRPKQFAVKPTPAETGKAWKLNLRRPSKGSFEDFHVELLGVPAFFSDNPSGLLKPVE